jgi:thiol:disulfide interchange protein
MRSRRIVVCFLLLAILAAACTTPGGASLPTSSASTPPASLAASTPAPSTAQPATPAPTASSAAQASASAASWILYDPGLDAPAAIEAALAQAKVDGKHVLLDFGADWCPDCHVLDSYFEDPRAQAILENSYHVVRIDVGYFDKNLESATKYGNNVIGVGIPSVVILDAKGTKLVDTAAGELADSRRYTADDIVKFLSSWAS